MTKTTDIRIRKIKHGMSGTAEVRYTRSRISMHAVHRKDRDDLWALISPGSSFALFYFRGDDAEARRVLRRYFALYGTMTNSEVRSALIKETRI